MRPVLVAGIASAILLIALLLGRPMLPDLGSPARPPTDRSVGVPLPEERNPLVRPISPAPPTTAPEVAVFFLEAVEQDVISLTNEERISRGLSSLSGEPALGETARWHSKDMLQRGFFDHVNPDGLTTQDRVATVHRRLVGLTGENIWETSGTNSKGLAASIVASWMSSADHRENILRPDYTDTGVGFAVAGAEVRGTQVFTRTVALTSSIIPASVSRGQPLEIAATTSAGAICEQFDLWSAERGLVVFGPAPAAPNVVLNAPPGIYRLRFYVPGPRGNAIFPGPRIEVK